jgi:hypothetical protein
MSLSQSLSLSLSLSPLLSTAAATNNNSPSPPLGNNDSQTNPLVENSSSHRDRKINSAPKRIKIKISAGKELFIYDIYNAVYTIWYCCLPSIYSFRRPSYICINSSAAYFGINCGLSDSSRLEYGNVLQHFIIIE